MVECSKKDTCKNYDKKCFECWTMSSMHDIHPCYTSKDLVEVVRCKDCKFNMANMEKDPLDITDYSGDDIVCSYFMTDGLDPNDYCSQGKRTPQKEG